MSDNLYFTSVASWKEAEAQLAFRPRQPRDTAGFRLESLAIHVRDHKKRELPVGSRSLEAHYGGFVLSQARKGEGPARRAALRVAYGQDARPAKICGREGRAYELGPEVPADDIDGRTPAVVVWHDGDMFYLVASTELAQEVLVGVAVSMYAPANPRTADAGGT